jgi:hypothetical protein
MPWSKWSGSSARWPCQKDQCGDDQGEWKFVKRRKAKETKKTDGDDSNIIEKPPGSSKDPAKAKVSTKAKRTFLEIVLGEGSDADSAEKVAEKKKKEQGEEDARAMALGKVLEVISDVEGMADLKATVEKDLAATKKPAAKQKAKSIQIEAKAAFIEREEKRLTELEQDIAKATTALAQRRVALEKERGALTELRTDLLKNIGGDMDIDSTMDDLERKELELLRKLSANFQVDGNVANLADAKRLSKDLEEVQKDIKRRRTEAHPPSGC